MAKIPQIAKTAVKLENEEMGFYKRFAGKASHPLGRKMLQSLIEDTKKHLEVLKKILTEFDFSSFDRDLEGGSQQRIKKVFDELGNELDKQISTNFNHREVLRLGMKMEEESIGYYKNYLKRANDSRTKALLERLVTEGRGHYQILQNTYFFLEDSESWFLWEERGILDGG